ncbi:MAG: holo-ACP synthase [Firmicutes bacterium]|nr:holo-ACP synthase [Bacillota bacterium]
MIGTDLINIERIKKAVESEYFLINTFSKNEIEYAKSRKDYFESLAGIFAAKEAVLKATGTGIVDLRLNKIEILHNEKGQPYHRLNSDKLVNVSISHDSGFAIAVAMII